jgi:hypothetical protein
MKDHLSFFGMQGIFSRKRNHHTVCQSISEQRCFSQYPAETLGLALAEARSGPGAAPIIVQTRSSTRANYGRR